MQIVYWKNNTNVQLFKLTKLTKLKDVTLNQSPKSVNYYNELKSPTFWNKVTYRSSANANLFKLVNSVHDEKHLNSPETSKEA